MVGSQPAPWVGTLPALGWPVVQAVVPCARCAAGPLCCGPAAPSRLGGSQREAGLGRPAIAALAAGAALLGRCSHSSGRRRSALRAVASGPAPQLLPDGRRYRVFDSEEEVGPYIRARVAELATAAIAAKGAFSLSIGSGTTVEPLEGLKEADGVDFSRVHVFFGNERTSGDDAGKCYRGALDFIQACGIPLSNVHAVGVGAPDAVAERYETLIQGMLPEVIGRCERNGYPALDLFLLGTGSDGHAASLYPGSAQVLQSPSARLILPAEGKGGVTASLDYIGSARHVILSAAKPTQAIMVSKALRWPNPASNTECPAGMISAAAGTEVEWLLTTVSAAVLLA